MYGLSHAFVENQYECTKMYYRQYKFIVYVDGP